MNLFARRGSLMSASSCHSSKSLSSWSISIGVSKRPRVHKAASCGSLRRFMSESMDDSDTTFATLPSTRSTRVQLCEDQNEYYTSPWRLVLDSYDDDGDDDDDDNDNDDTDNEIDVHVDPASTDNLINLSQKAVWYHQGDVAKFKHAAQMHARLVMTRERQQTEFNNNNQTLSPSWSHSMWTAYQGLYKATTLDEMNAVMGAVRQQPMEPSCVGLEKWALSNLRTLKTQQRKALVRGIVARQYQPHLGSEKQLRRLSRDLSRPSRLFAAYIGRAVQE